MKPSSLFDLYAEPNRTAFLTAAFVSVSIIAFADYIIVPNFTLGVLYILPILLAAGFLSRWKLTFLALACALLREGLGPVPWGIESMTRIFLGFAAFTGSGLFVSELARNREMAINHFHRIQQETKRREDVEKELQILVNDSPAAILILDDQLRVVMANSASVRMFALGGEWNDCVDPIDSFLPILKNIQEMRQSPDFRHTEMESTAYRQDGQVFRAHLWISIYRIGSGARYAVIAIDVSDELRDREESGVDRLLANSRVLMGAVAHEIRNLCGAIAVAHANLKRLPGIAGSEDFRALGNLLDALRKLASAELRPLNPNRLAAIPLRRVLDDLRIVIEPTFKDMGARIVWELPSSLPSVWAEDQTLLQIFLNLTQNSQRAIESSPVKILKIQCKSGTESVTVSFIDSGIGVRHPEWLFRPYQEGADASGLGLYISRAIARSFGGDVRFEPQKEGAGFSVDLSLANEVAREIL
jgi:two-component system, LuxR family, sensor kinase FixL